MITANNDSNSNQNVTYSSWLGLTSASGPNGAAMSIGYDGYARPLQSVSPHGAFTTYVYTSSPPTKTATTNGKWVKTTMDGLGRTIKVESGYNNGATPVTVSTVDTVYDSCGCSPVGKMKQVSQPYAPGGTGYWTVYNYDGTGRTTSVVAPDGSVTASYAYLANTTTVTDAAGKWKTFTTDAMGNLAQVVERNPSWGTFSTAYAYDAVNHLIQVTMPRG